MLNKDKYIDKFLDESFENISIVEKTLFDLNDGLALEDNLVVVLRALHTLKGSARLLEYKNIETLAHAMENLFIAFKEQRISMSERMVQLVLSTIDYLKEGFAAIKNIKSDAISPEQYEKNLNFAAANDDFEIPKREKKQDIPKGEIQEEEGKNKTKDHKEEILRSDSIRISLDKVNDIIKDMASLQAIEINAKNIASEIEALREKARLISRTMDRTQNVDSDSFGALFHELERGLSKITPRLRNYAIDAGNITKAAYNSVLMLRMLPLSIIFDNYPRYVFELASELHKKVTLIIEGKENEIDKNIIEMLSDVFLHILRNAIDHGIEVPEERIAKGKSETGNLKITCIRESGNMKIIIADDGRGLDYEKIRAKATAHGLVSKEAASSLSDDDLANFIFQSGFSTAEAVNKVSGRGVGMDVVRHNIEQMKGSIVMNSVQGQGMTFTIIVPLSVAALMGFPVTSGNMKFIIPANFVYTMLIIRSNDIIEVIDRPAIKLDNKIIKLYYLNQLLGIKDDQKKEKETLFVVVVNAYEETIAIVVDVITSMKSVILKSLPAFMEDFKVFSGAVLSEDYEMVPVLHIPTIIKMAKRTKLIDTKKRYVDFEKALKSILVVDDSLPTREIEQDILESEGYRVDLAADGAEALMKAKTTRYDLICTDINMPQMDGMMLTDNIRKNDSLKHIPIIIITSRENEEAKKKAFSLGANKYIVKSSFDNYNLVESVRELIGKA